MKFKLEQSSAVNFLDKVGGFANFRTGGKDLIPFAMFLEVKDGMLYATCKDSMNCAKYSTTISTDEYEEGVALIRYDEFSQWIKTQSNHSKYIFNLKKLEQQEIIHVESLDMEANKVLKKVGVLQMYSKTKTGQASKWEMDVFDKSHFTMPEFLEGEVAIKPIECGVIQDIVHRLSISSLKNHSEHIFDNICIDRMNDSVLFSTTDKSRCAVIKMDANVLGENIDRLLVPILTLGQIVSKFNPKNILTMNYDKENNKLIFRVGSEYVSSITCTSHTRFGKFPNVRALMLANQEHLSNIEYSVLKDGATNLKIVNDVSTKVFFKSQDSYNLIMKSVPLDSRKKIANYAATIEKPKADFSGVFSVMHILDIVKVLVNDTESVSVFYPPEKKQWLRFTYENVNYFIMGLSGLSLKAYDEITA
jgi:hypothetical protein